MGEQSKETGVDIDRLWLGIKNTYMETGISTLGYIYKKRKKWLSDKTWKLIEERKCIKNKSLSVKEAKVTQDLQEQYRAKIRK